MLTPDVHEVPSKRVKVDPIEFGSVALMGPDAETPDVRFTKAPAETPTVKPTPFQTRVIRAVEHFIHPHTPTWT